MAAEAVALQFPDDLAQTGVLCLTRKHHRFERIQVIRKLILAVPDRADEQDEIGRYVTFEYIVATGYRRLLHL